MGKIVSFQNWSELEIGALRLPINNKLVGKETQKEGKDFSHTTCCTDDPCCCWDGEVSLTYLYWYLPIVEINDDDVANLLRVGDAGIVTASGIAREHLQSGAFDL